SRKVSTGMEGRCLASRANVFAVLEALRKNAERESLRLRDRFVAACAVREDAGDLRHLADPAAIVFTLDVDGEVAHRHDPTPKNSRANFGPFPSSSCLKNTNASSHGCDSIRRRQWASIPSTYSVRRRRR